MGLREMDRRLDIDSNRSATRRVGAPAATAAGSSATSPRTRCGWRASGTAFAVTLMFMELGFRGALLDSMVAVVRSLDGDLFLIHRLLYTLAVPQPIAHGRLEQSAVVRRRDRPVVRSTSRCRAAVAEPGRRYSPLHPRAGLPRPTRHWRSSCCVDRALWERPELRDGGRPLQGRPLRPPGAGRVVGALGPSGHGRGYVRAGDRLRERRHARLERGELFVGVPRPALWRVRSGRFGVLRVRQGTDLEQLRAAMLAELPHESWTCFITLRLVSPGRQAFW